MSQNLRHLLICIPLGAAVLGCSSSDTETSSPSAASTPSNSVGTSTTDTGVLGSTTPAGSALTPVPCEFDAPGLTEGTDLSCGSVLRGDVTLFVTIVGDGSTLEATDPIVHLPGGPGASSEAYAPILAETYLALAEQTDRAVVFVDQRGTGRSTPQLSCDDPIDAVACSTELEEGGIDLKVFSTVEAADDIAAVAAALGVDQVNLWGPSYGSRLALEVTRRHPDLVRSLLIESVDTADTPLAAISGVQGALARIDARCSTDPECVGLDVELVTDVDAVAITLDSTPVTTSFGPLTAPDFIATTLALMEGSQGSSLVPLWVHAARIGDVGTLDAILAKSASEPTPGGPFSEVMNIVTNCNDLAPFDARSTLDSLAPQATAPLATALLGKMDAQYGAGCDGWTVAADGPTEAVTSDVATLVFTGADDSNTPLDDAELAATSLTNATVVAWPAYGHFPFHRGGNACAASIYAQFLAEPSADVDSACVSPGDFVTTIGSSSELDVASVELPGIGVAVDLPATWLEVTDGTFVSVDGAAVAIQPSPQSTADTLASITQTLTVTGQPADRQLGGATWTTVSATTTLGERTFSVRIAATPTDATSLTVVISAPTDEAADRLLELVLTSIRPLE
jgi:pimeloyl-ACP methyl ester carboxylesterase